MKNEKIISNNFFVIKILEIIMIHVVYLNRKHIEIEKDFSAECLKMEKWFRVHVNLD